MVDSNARDQLAAAHQQMTPAEIAAHALDLVDAVEQQAALIARYGALVRNWHASRVTDLRAQDGVQNEIKRASSLFAAGQLAAGVALIRSLAALPPAPRSEPLDPTTFPPPPPASLLNPLIKD